MSEPRTFEQIVEELSKLFRPPIVEVRPTVVVQTVIVPDPWARYRAQPGTTR